MVVMGGASCFDQTGVTDHKLTDVVDGAGTELSIELLCSEGPQVVDGEGPQVEHVVPGEGVSLLQQHHPSSHEAQLHRRPQTTGPRPDDHTLANQRKDMAHQSETLRGSGFYNQHLISTSYSFLLKGPFHYFHIGTSLVTVRPPQPVRTVRSHLLFKFTIY